MSLKIRSLICNHFQQILEVYQWQGYCGKALTDKPGFRFQGILGDLTLRGKLGHILADGMRGEQWESRYSMHQPRDEVLGTVSNTNAGLPYSTQWFFQKRRVFRSQSSLLNIIIQTHSDKMRLEKTKNTNGSLEPCNSSVAPEPGPLAQPESLQGIGISGPTQTFKISLCIFNKTPSDVHAYLILRSTVLKDTRTFYFLNILTQQAYHLVTNRKDEWDLRINLITRTI